LEQPVALFHLNQQVTQDNTRRECGFTIRSLIFFHGLSSEYHEILMVNLGHFYTYYQLIFIKAFTAEQAYPSFPSASIISVAPAQSMAFLNV
jgi:hypothetical protein